MRLLYDWLTPDIVTKLRPYRLIFIGIAVVSLFFAFLIVLENVVFLSIYSKQSVIFLLVPYFLSWVLVILGYAFARLAFLLHRRTGKASISIQPRSAWSDSRPISPISITSVPETSFLNLSRSSFRAEMPIVSSPFFISDGQQFLDEPPSYEQAIARASPQPPASPLPTSVAV